MLRSGLIKYRNKLYQDNKYATCVLVFRSWNKTCSHNWVSVSALFYVWLWFCCNKHLWVELSWTNAPITTSGNFGENKWNHLLDEKKNKVHSIKSIVRDDNINSELFWDYKNVFTFRIICKILLNRRPNYQWSNPTRGISYTVNTMPADALVTWGARASAGMILIPKARIFCLQHLKS